MEDEIKKIYWTMSEASAMLGVRESHIRHYDDILHLHIDRGTRQRRRLTREMIEKIKVLVEMTTYMHLRGIKRAMREGKLDALIRILKR